MSVKPNREYRDFYSAEFEPLEESGFLVRGYATTFNDPYVLFEDDGIQYKEMIAPTALDDADFSDVIFLYNHQGMVYARNKKTDTLRLVPDETGLAVEADLRLLADFGGGEMRGKAGRPKAEAVALPKLKKSEEAAAIWAGVMRVLDKSAVMDAVPLLDEKATRVCKERLGDLYEALKRHLEEF